MIMRKQEQFVAEDEAPFIFRRLRRAHREGILNDREYEDWYEKFLIARAEKDCKFFSCGLCGLERGRNLTSKQVPALHRIRAHLRIMEAGAPGRPLTSNSRSKSSSSSPKSKDRRRRHSVDDATSPRRSASPRERRRRDRDEETEEEDSDYYDEKRRTRRQSPRSSSVRDPRREREGEKVGARPDQFIRAPKRASTVTGYGTPEFAPGTIPVPVLLPAPVRRSSSTATGSRSRSSSARRYEEPESESSGSETEDTDYDEKKSWGSKKQLPPPRRERRRPWEDKQWDEKRDRVKA